MLKNAYQQLAEDNYNILAHDYWNFAVSYAKMGQPKQMIYDFLFKAKYADKKDFCEIVKKYHEFSNGLDSSKFYKLLGQDYKQLVLDCDNVETNDKFDIEEYIRINSYDKELIYKLDNLLREDQKLRKEKDTEKLKEQSEFDKVNILIAESILTKYGYPGRKMVGEKFDFVIWIVLQHADLSFQEKYLPVIVKAVNEGELGKTPLRMLLDRIYSKKTGFQIFGSQVGVPFSDNKTIEEVKLKYEL